MEDFEHRPPDKDDPESLKYMPSVKQYGNAYYNQYIDKKAEARIDLANNGKMSNDYMNYINKPVGQYRPSGLKIFPSIGMISNKQTFTTHKHRDEVHIQDRPMGIDEYDNAQHYLHFSKEVKFKDDYIGTKNMLRELKPPKIKKNKGR